MAYPAGVVTTQLTFGTAQAMIGQDALAMTVKVTPTTNLVYGGNVFIADTKVIQVAAGGSGAVTLINPDQPGFFNGGGLAIRNWGYTFEITYTNASSVAFGPITKLLTWFASDTGPLDVDTMVPIADGSGILVPASSVASAIGQLASTTDAAVAALLASATATRNALDARYATTAFTTYASREALVASIGTTPALGTSIGATGKDVYLEAYWTAGPAVRMRYAVTSTDPTAADPTAVALGGGKWLTQVFTGQPSVYQFGSRCDGGVHDDFPATQAAATWAQVGGASATNTRTVRFPPGQYFHSAPIVFGTAGQPMTRVAFIGEGARASVVFVQTAANTAHWSIIGNYVWGNTWRNISYAWSTTTTASNTARVAFQIGSSGDFYNNIIDTGMFGGGHYFAKSAGMLWWGNRVSNFIIGGDVTGGFYSLTGASGQPNSSFENIYITASSMVGPIMLGNALDVEYRSFEINQVGLGAQILQDQGGGYHAFTTIRIEAFTYNASKTLIDVTNSKLTAERMYFVNGSIGPNTTVTMLVGGNNTLGTIDVGIVDMWTNNFGSGSFIDVYGGPGGASIGSRQAVARIGDVRPLNLAFNSQVRLTNVDASTAADGMYVDGWDNPSRTEFWGDTDVTLTCTEPRVNVFTAPLSVDRTVSLPGASGSLDRCNWSGRRFELYKEFTGYGALIVKDGATEIARLPTGNKGMIVVVWNRGSLPGGPARGWSVVNVQAT